MSQFIARAVLAVLILAVPGACSSSKGGGGAGGAGGGGTGGGGAAGTGGAGGSGTGGSGTGGAGATGGAGGASVDANPALMAPKDCRGLRNCVDACDKDTACAMRCVSSAPATARDLYMMIQTCSKMACPQQDLSCRCDNECFGGGQCTELVDKCNGADPDNFCDPVGPKCGL
jgi:hypothetical protein